MKTQEAPNYVGYKFSPVSHEISADTIKQYAIASADYNPLHLDEQWMEKADFGGTAYNSIIAHGLMMYSYVATMITQTVYPLGGWHERCEMRFKAPVFPGDTVITRGHVTQVRSMDDFELYEVDVTVENQDGKVVQQGTAYGRLPKELGADSIQVNR